VLVGMGNEKSYALNAIISEISIIGIVRYANVYGTLIELLQKYRKKLKIFLGNMISIDELPEFWKIKYTNFLKTIVEL
jgi:hypothetical protein